MTDLAAIANLDFKLALSQLRELGVEGDLRPIAWLMTQYPSGAHGPLNTSRSRELSMVQAAGAHHGLTITGEDLDWAMAVRFADGCEYEWSAD